MNPDNPSKNPSDPKANPRPTHTAPSIPILPSKPITHVKFMFEDPLRLLATKDKDSDSVSQLSRPYTYHPGMEERDRYSLYLDDDDADSDDDPRLPDRIDLRALLFNRQGPGEESVARSAAHGHSVPTPLLRRLQAYAPRITQDLIQQENKEVQSKVSTYASLEFQFEFLV
jgi:hypothetical protein